MALSCKYLILVNPSVSNPRPAKSAEGREDPLMTTPPPFILEMEVVRCTQAAKATTGPTNEPSSPEIQATSPICRLNSTLSGSE